MFRVLILEHDPLRLSQLERTVFGGGYEPLPADTVAEAMEVLDRKYVDFLLLDLTTLGAEGCSFLQQLRHGGWELPVLALGDRQTLADRKYIFSLGADDDMAWPVDGEELLLRMAALLRRARISIRHRLTVGQTELCYDTLSVTRDGKTQVLPPKEFLVLFKLLSYPNRVFTRHQLMDEIWDLESESNDHTVCVHINRLRNRFRENPDFQILTVRNLGYKAVCTK